MKKNIWYSEETGFLGSTGVESVREMAELAATDRDICDILGIGEWPTSIDAVETELNGLGIRAESVPAGMLYSERWDSNKTRFISIDERPGRGRVKVLGASL